MSRSTYAPKHTYLGTGSKLDYTFDFKIESLAQLLVIEMDDSDVETQRVRGTDVTYISSVDYDPVDGAGTVNLAANLPANYTLIILLANDEPTQPYEFKNKGSFTLKRIEAALDFVAGAIQRLTYRSAQALRLHEHDDETAIDTSLPPNLPTDGIDRYMKVNATGDGFEYGVTLAELIAAAMPVPTTAGEVVEWNGAAWIASLAGGGLFTSATQDIAASGQITLNSARQQLLPVQGNGGPQTTANAPFASTPPDGTIVVLLGKSDSNLLEIPYVDVAGGCMVKGDCYLGLNDTLTLMYVASMDRYLEIARN